MGGDRSPVSAATNSPPADVGAVHELPPLPIHGFPGTPEEIERQWYAEVYLGRGDSMRQLTWRAVLMGSVLGGVLSVTNLYIGLKAGWGFGVAITACILSYAIWTALSPRGHGAHPHDDPREQLHAVHGQLGRLLHGRHADLRVRGVDAHQQRDHAAAAHARVGVPPGGARA